MYMYIGDCVCAGTSKKQGPGPTNSFRRAQVRPVLMTSLRDMSYKIRKGAAVVNADIA